MIVDVFLFYDSYVGTCYCYISLSLYIYIYTYIYIYIYMYIHIHIICIICSFGSQLNHHVLVPAVRLSLREERNTIMLDYILPFSPRDLRRTPNTIVGTSSDTNIQYMCVPVKFDMSKSAWCIECLFS